jgi:putative endonuclease
MYSVQCSDETIYCGVTNNLPKRIDAHNTGKGAKYTRSRAPVRLLAKWSYPNRSTAQSAEYQFKKLSRAEKCVFIENPETWISKRKSKQGL